MSSYAKPFEAFCAIGLLAVSAFALATGSARTAIEGPQFVEIGTSAFNYRLSGDYERNGQPVSAPMTAVDNLRPFSMMVRQVTVAEYQNCVDDRACQPLLSYSPHDMSHPVVDVNYRDATAYASWLSKRTGRIFRLPTDAEWVRAAGSNYRDDEVAIDNDPSNPSKRWLTRYEQGDDPNDTMPKPIGTFGSNEFGLLDMTSNVSEWTDTCFSRNIVDTATGKESATRNCGIRAVEGRSRSYMTDFMRESRFGGCASGKPPGRMGFRLVEETAISSKIAALAIRLKNMIQLR